jgi:prepilin-type N-terminal cleavage/methylation domain-containing protein
MKRDGKTRINQQGFTMIEVVVVLIVLVIVSTVIVSRSFTTGTNELMVEADGLKASLRYAQIQSLNNDTATWGIRFPDATTYRLYNNNADASSMIPVKGAAGDPETVACPKNCHQLQGSVQIISPSSAKTINFDKWGRPMDGTTLLSEDYSIILGQGTQSTITITKNTGYIP